MRRFVDLYLAMDATTKTNEKVAAMSYYFSVAPPADSAWALSLLMGRRPRVPVRRGLLRQWCLEVSGLSEWLFDECYGAVGDLSETLALLIPVGEPPDRAEQSLAWWMDCILGLVGHEEAVQREHILAAWERLDPEERFVFHKLLGGSFRVGVSRDLVIRALSQATSLATDVLAQRLMGDWKPSASFYEALTSTEPEMEGGLSRPYPFCLSHPLTVEVEELGDRAEWQAEWKWDGIRAQLIRRGTENFLWSRGEDLIHEAFPEVAALADLLADGTVVDGEILAWRDGRPLPFAELQRRINRKTVGKKLLSEVPCTLVVFDVLEVECKDWRRRPLAERRLKLETLGLPLSPIVQAATWDDLRAERERPRGMMAEGLMLKKLGSDYATGRKRGAWWKWKVSPFTVDAVLIYAQRGTGKRASLYTDYTFGVWQDDVLVPIAKAYSGLDDDEIQRVDSFVRRNSLEKFGPVRTVKPELVFELAFEGIQRSDRHKSGIAVRFPRILRWRQDKTPDQADTLDGVKGLLGG